MRQQMSVRTWHLRCLQRWFMTRFPWRLISSYTRPFLSIRCSWCRQLEVRGKSIRSDRPSMEFSWRKLPTVKVTRTILSSKRLSHSWHHSMKARCRTRAQPSTCFIFSWRSRIRCMVESGKRCFLLLRSSVHSTSRWAIQLVRLSISSRHRICLNCQLTILSPTLRPRRSF